MRRGGRRGGRGAGSRGGIGSRRGAGVCETRAAGKAGFVSSVFALLGRMIPARGAGRRRDGGRVRGIDDPWATGSSTAQPITGSSASPQGVSTRRRASVDVQKCTGCGICAQVCPAGAISVGSAAVPDAQICTGCGRCVAQCPQDAITLVEITRAANKILPLIKKEK